MDVLDKFLKKVSYKFPKGYPDINNEQDMIMLEGMLKALLKEAPSSDAKEAIDILKSKLGLTDDKFTEISSKRFKILVPRADRYSYIEKVEGIEGFDYDPNIKGSSIGGITYKNVVFLLKPESAQGRASAGVGNEDFLEKKIKEFQDQGAKNILFISPDKNYPVQNFTNVKGTGLEVVGGSKSDIDFFRGENKIAAISIKKDNAGFWESSDTRYKKIVTTLADKIKKGEFAPELTFIPFRDQAGRTKEGIFTMFNKQTQQKVAGVIVTDLPSDDTDSIIFGSDNAVVIYRTFSPKDFSLEGDTLRIKVSKIIEDTQDVEKFNLQPVLRIRHDSTRSATGGLRALVQPENTLYKDGKLKGNNIELSYNEII
tara:strand:+ start:2529 stop:3638 length:1110 start_codon:yes stop_codon:yes gene_type:complete